MRKSRVGGSSGRRWEVVAAIGEWWLRPGSLSGVSQRDIFCFQFNHLKVNLA